MRRNSRDYYTLGFLFEEAGNRIAWVDHDHGPMESRGYNGFGGSMNDDESAVECMRREFLEESGWKRSPEWRSLGATKHGEGWTIFLHAAIVPRFRPFEGREPVVALSVWESVRFDGHLFARCARKWMRESIAVLPGSDREILDREARR